MEKGSIWKTFNTSEVFPTLNDVLHVDVSIIGGGITGISTAYFLKKAGLKVALLEAGEIGMGTTGHSTGNLYLIIDELLSSLDSKYDQDTIKKILKGRGEALATIEQICKNESIDCDYKEQPMYLFSDDKVEKIEKELSLASSLGISNVDIKTRDFEYKANKILKYPKQAQFNPLRYVTLLAKKINSKECQIFTNSSVKEIKQLELGSYFLRTSHGSVSSRFLVHATHTPKGVDLKYNTMLGPYREYGLAAKLRDEKYPSGIYWEYKANEKFSFRSYKRDGQSYLLAVGKPYKVGQAKNNKVLLDALGTYVNKKFSVQEITHFWGGQNYKPADLLPFIGRKSAGENEFLATGFSTDGLIYGTLSGKIITDLITENKNEYQEIFNSLRVNPVKSAKTYTKENLNVAKQFLKDRILENSTEKIGNLKIGEGKIINVDGEKLAISKIRNRRYEIISAYCSHLGCVIHWNNLEKTWDCPCHGSRFKPSGEVIEGPALEPLQKIEKK